MHVLRDNSRPLAAHVLALLAVVWLNMALSPCVMAMAQSLAAQAPMQMEGTGCGHCPDSTPPCHDGDQQAPCALAQQLSSQDSVLAQPAETYTPDPVLVDTRAVPRATRAPPRPSPHCAVRQPGPGAPLYLVHCAFLK